MEARIDRLTGDDSPPQLSPEKVADGLGRAVHWLKWSNNYWIEMLEKWKIQPNKFLAYFEVENKKIDATPGGRALHAYWILPPDEVSIIRVTPPKALYWAVEFGNYLWETMDYRYRLASTNDYHAVLKDDGELIIIVSHDDPGVPNWLDPSGHSEGYFTIRWLLADSYPYPEAQQVKRADLFDHLPSDLKRITPDQRRAPSVPMSE